MSDLAFWGLIGGVVLLGLAMFGVLLWDRSQPTEDSIGDPYEEQYWTAQVSTVTRDFGLNAIRAAAGKWAASAAAILGVLSTVAIVAGPENLVDDVGGTEADIAAALVLVAAGLAALATLLAGLAEQGTPVDETLTAGKLRALTRVRANRAASQIRWSRTLTAIALLLIAAAAGTAWLAALSGKEASSAQSALVISGSGAMCGTLTVDSTNAVALALEGGTEAIPGNAQVTLVDSCPD